MKRVQYTDSDGRYQYDIMRLYDGEKILLSMYIKLVILKNYLPANGSPILNGEAIVLGIKMLMLLCLVVDLTAFL